MPLYIAGIETGEDPNLVTGNIRYGVTIEGVAGHANVRDISDADAVEANVQENKTFYAVSGGIRTGVVA